METDGTWNYTWNAENRLVAAEKPDGSQRVEFVYDHMGRRVEKKVYSGSTDTALQFGYMEQDFYSFQDVITLMRKKENGDLEIVYFDQWQAIDPYYPPIMKKKADGTWDDNISYTLDIPPHPYSSMVDNSATFYWSDAVVYTIHGADMDAEYKFETASNSFIVNDVFAQQLFDPSPWEPEDGATGWFNAYEQDHNTSGLEMKMFWYFAGNKIQVHAQYQGNSFDMEIQAFDPDAQTWTSCPEFDDGHTVETFAASTSSPTMCERLVVASTTTNYRIRINDSTGEYFYNFDKNGMSLASRKQFLYDGYKLIHESNKEYDYQTQQLSSSKTQTYLWYGESLLATKATSHLAPVSSQQFFYLTDANKNVSYVVATDGTVAASYEYSPFGKVIREDISSQFSSFNFPFKFSSEYHDEETSLVYYNYRYYNPDLGRWLSRDPIGERGGLNLYRMVGNNPIDYWDLLGKMQMELGITYSDAQALFAQAQYEQTHEYEQSNQSFDWTSVLEAFLLDHAALSGSLGSGITIPVGVGGFVSVGVSGSVKAFKCKDRNGATRSMVQFSPGVEVQGGVGAGLGIKKYPVPRGKNVNKRDSATGQKLKKLAGKNLPWYKQTGSSKGGGFSYDKGCSCPKEGWTGSVKVGIGAEVGAGLIAGGKTFAQWEFGKPFDWSSIEGKVEGCIEFRAEAVAKIYVFGSADGTWSKYIK